MLTDRKIRGLRPSGKTFKAYDTRGLFIQVTPRGMKSWHYRYSFDGREKKISIGQYPEVSLSAARDRAIDLRRTIENGTDPIAARRESRQQELLSQPVTLADALDEWAGMNFSRYAENTIYSHERNINYIKKLMGNKSITGLTTPVLFGFVIRARDERGAHVAGSIKSILSRALQLAVLRGTISHNPARELTGVIPKPKSVGRAALPVCDIGRFMADLHNYKKLHPFTRIALKLLMLTFVRPGELCGGEWSEIDWQARRWVIPEHRMKQRREHVVPLSAQAVALLEELREYSGRSQYLFPSSGKRRHMASNTLNQALHRMCYRVTPHGFRAMASSTFNEHGFRPDVIERQLAHIEQNMIRAAYNRAEYLDERTRMMQWYADFIDDQRRK